MNRLLYIFFFSITIFSRAFAGDYYANINKFLFVQPSQLAMAQANLAYGRNAGPAANPANLPLDSTSEISLSYGGFWGNAFSTSVINYVTSLSKSDGFGVSMGYLHIPDIMDTRGLSTTDDDKIVWDESDVSYETSSELYLTFGYGKSFRPTSNLAISAGFSIHALRRRLLEETGYGIGADIGATAHFLQTGWRLSVLADDISTNFIYWDDTYYDQTLPHVRLGVGWQKEFPYIHGRLTAAYQTPDLLHNEGIRVLHDKELDKIEVREDGKYLDDISYLFTGGRFGFEYYIRNIVAMRVGFLAGQVSFGGGVNLFDNSLGIDFGYVGSDLPATYILSFSYRMK